MEDIIFDNLCCTLTGSGAVPTEYGGAFVPKECYIGILRKEGYDVKNGDFFKIGIPFTLSAIVPAYILIWLLFGM